MPNRNYINGRRKEYKIVNQEKANGKLAFRTAGSHSPIDVVSIDVINKKILLIQSKPNSWTQNRIDKLINNYELFDGIYEVQFDVR